MRGSTFNTADKIQDQLHYDGHRVWGFVVYRCTYGDDAAWQTFLERINASIRDSLEFHHGLDLLEEDCFKLTVLEDVSKFDGASVQLVREHFKEWRKNAVHEDQGTSEEIEARRVKPEPIPVDDTWPKAEMNMELWTRLMGDVKEAPRKEPRLPFRIASSKNAYGYHCPAVRYTFCIQIDDAALQSIVSPEGKECYGDAWVNLIEADWDPEEAAKQREEDRIEHLETGGTLEEFEDCVEFFPEVDGCIEENVGWMKVQYKALIPEFYEYLQDPNTLERIYYRPPDMAGGLGG